MTKQTRPLFVPPHLTKEHEKWIENITEQFVAMGLTENWIRKWWQTDMYELNGFKPLEAVCNDKGDLAQMCADKTKRMIERKKTSTAYEEYRKQIMTAAEEINDVQSEKND